MSSFYQSGKDRAAIRGAGVKFFRPPDNQLAHLRWHEVDTPARGRMRMQWRPGIDVWHDMNGQRWTAEGAQRLGWTYVGVSDNQEGGKP